MSPLTRTARVISAWSAVVAIVLAAAFIVMPMAASAATSPDDEIPGVVLTPSPVSGSLVGEPAEQWDLDDLYAVSLAPNQRFEATLTPGPSADFDLYLIPPTARTLAEFLEGVVAPAAASVTETAGAPEAIRYVCDRSTPSTYFVDVAWWNGTGPYELTWRITQLAVPSMVVTAPATAPYGAYSGVTGSMSLDSVELQGITVRLYSRTSPTASWKKLSESQTTAGGAFGFSVKPSKVTQYRVVSRWGTAVDGREVGFVASEPVTIAPLAKLSLWAPSGAKVRTAFSVSGSIKPSHARSTKHIRILAEQIKAGVVVRTLKFYAPGSKTTFAGKVTLPAKGTWRLTASAGADSLHAATVSSSRTVTVK